MRHSYDLRPTRADAKQVARCEMTDYHTSTACHADAYAYMHVRPVNVHLRLMQCTWHSRTYCAQHFVSPAEASAMQ